MKLHLFSSPGRDDIRYILDACRLILDGRVDPLVAYLPCGSLSDQWQDYIEDAFRGIAHVASINTELQTLPEMEAVLRGAALVYIPGGNTFLLNHRLHSSGLIDYLRKKVMTGLPVVAYSAGTVLCGPNILTSNDINVVSTCNFTGLNLIPFNMLVHYPEDEIGRAKKDNWLSEYFTFHENPVLIMADGAYVQVAGKRTSLVRGDAWLKNKGKDKEKITPGATINI
jgi:dipeptidase E